MSSLEWLPPLCLECDFAHWQSYQDALYEHFQNDFIHSPPRFKGCDFRLKRFPLIRGLHATFWHLISTGEGTAEDRQIRIERCERIRWPRAMIDRLGTSDIRTWQAERYGETRIQISLPDFSYLAVLAVRTGYVLLWTAFDVEYDHQRLRLEKEHDAYQAGKAPKS